MQTEALDVLINLASDDTAAQECMLSSGACSAVLAVMDLHVALPSVQERGCSFLSGITDGVDSQGGSRQLSIAV